MTKEPTKAAENTRNNGRGLDLNTFHMTHAAMRVCKTITKGIIPTFHRSRPLEEDKVSKKTNVHQTAKPTEEIAPADPMRRAKIVNSRIVIERVISLFPSNLFSLSELARLHATLMIRFLLDCSGRLNSTARHGNCANVYQPRIQNRDILGRRIIAFVLDLLFVFLASTTILVILSAIFGSSPQEFSTVLWSYLGLGLLNLVIIQGRTGRSVGKALTGIKVVDERTEVPPGIAAAFLRTLLLVVELQFLGLVSLLSVILSPQDKRLGDILAGTVVLRS